MLAYFFQGFEALTLTHSRSLLGPGTGRQLLHLHHHFGASPQALSRYGNHPDKYEIELLKKITAIKPNKVSDIFSTYGSTGNSHSIIVVEPQPGHRDMPARRIASESIFKLLWKNCSGSRIQVMAEVYNELSSEPSFAEAAGWVFKYRMHQLLGAGREIEVYPLRGPSPGQ